VDGRRTAEAPQSHEREGKLSRFLTGMAEFPARFPAASPYSPETVPQDMKQLFVLVLVGVAIFCVYRFHEDRVKQVAEEARAAERRRLKPRRQHANPRHKLRPHLYAISRKLEPVYIALFSTLNSSNPVDLVPPLTLTRERLLDKKAKSIRSCNRSIIAPWPSSP